MSQADPERLEDDAPLGAGSTPLDTPPVRAESAEEPLSHLRKRVLQPIQARLYSRLNRMVDRLGYVPATLLLLAVTAVSVLGITFWNNPEKVTERAVIAKFYLAARRHGPPRYFGGQDIIRELKGQLAEGASASNRDRETLGYTNWTEAQLAVALKGSDTLDNAELAQWFQQQAGTCHCWLGRRNDHENVATTAWVLLAFASMQVKPTSEEIEFLLANQHRPGWWQFYHVNDTAPPTLLEDARNASTYATSFSILALQQLLEHHLVPQAQEPRVTAAVARGRNWLLSNVVPGNPGRWKDYPDGEDGHISIGLSGIVLHVLHRTPGPTPVDSDAWWMAQLPANLPAPAEVAISGQTVQIARDEWAREGTHMFAFPWLIVGTVDAYPQGSFTQRAQALRLFHEIPAEQEAIRAALQGKPWAASEFLIALRYLRGEDVI